MWMNSSLTAADILSWIHTKDQIVKSNYHTEIDSTSLILKMKSVKYQSFLFLNSARCSYQSPEVLQHLPSDEQNACNSLSWKAGEFNEHKKGTSLHVTQPSIELASKSYWFPNYACVINEQKNMFPMQKLITSFILVTVIKRKWGLDFFSLTCSIIAQLNS